MIGIIPFLVQWVALSFISRHNGFTNNSPNPYQKSHWGLLSDLALIPEDELELFLPQICNILTDREDNNDEFGLYGQFERIVLGKCASCLPFGMRFCQLLKAASASQSESIFRQVLSYSAQQAQNQMKQDRLRALIEHAEIATSNGYNLPHRYSILRASYSRDIGFLMESLSRLGYELKSYPANQRNHHLKVALDQINSLLFNRMISRGQGGYQQDNVNFFTPLTPGMTGLSAHQVAQNCPESVAYSLHFPMQHCSERALRILQFVSSESEVLPSKERCPFVVTVELLEQGFTCRSEQLYTQGHAVGTSAADVITGRRAPQSIELGPVMTGSSMPASTAPPSSGFQASPNSKPQADQINYRGGSSQQNSHQEQYHSIVDDEEVVINLTEIDGSIPQNRNENVLLFSREDIHHDMTADRDFPPANRDFPSANRDSPASKHTGEPYSSQLNDHLKDIRGGGDRGNSYGESNYQQPFPQNAYHSNYPAGFGQQPYQNQNQQHQQYETPQGNPYVNNNAYGQSDYGNSYNSDDLYNSQHTYENGLSTSHGYGNGFGQPVTQSPFSPSQSIGMYIKGKTWEEKREIVRRNSAFGHLSGWTLKTFIVKSGDDLRKEVLAMQLIGLFNKIFAAEGIDITLREYQIMSTGHMTGLVEYVEGSKSIDSIKKSSPDMKHLRNFFEYTFGASYSPVFAQALQNFAKSLAGYSLVQYILQLKDRHNANILVNSDGSLVHIDFGFIFGDSPGFNMNFEGVPFKLTREYIDLMGGTDSNVFRLFQDLFMRGFFALQKNSEAISAIVRLFYGPRRRQAADAVTARLNFAQSSDVVRLIQESLDSWRTKQYDWFQQTTNNISM